MGGHSYINFNTNQEKRGKIPGKLRILIVPLDWGLGHATRCIPIIKELVEQGCEIWAAGEGAIPLLLTQEFPGLQVIPLQGYRMRYSDTAKGFFWRIFRQIPKIRVAIKREHAWLIKKAGEYGFDAVISDNRFGLYYAKIPCIFITHQLNIKSPLGKWSEKILQRWNYKYINRFTECWIPDVESMVNLAGELSHPLKMPAIPSSYIGCLSRLKKADIGEKKGHLLILLSGPEPQRTILENKLIDELVHYNGTADIVRGLPSAETILPSTNHIRIYNHLPAGDINKKMSEAEFVISRTGYSTVMDLIQLKKKSILIPTPGQTEQVYLGMHLMKAKIAYCPQQNKFSLANALNKAKEFPYQFPEAITNNLQETVQRFVSELKNKF